VTWQRKNLFFVSIGFWLKMKNISETGKVPTHEQMILKIVKSLCIKMVSCCLQQNMSLATDRPTYRPTDRPTDRRWLVCLFWTEADFKNTEHISSESESVEETERNTNRYI